MGCDIHLILEKRTETGWVGISVFDPANHHSHILMANQPEQPEQWWAYPRVTARNYNLFAALAGVRGDGPEPKGLPLDVSELARDYINDGDGFLHSITHYTLRDCGPLFLSHYAPQDLLSPRRKEVLARLFNIPLIYIANEDSWLDDFRLIICFDN